MLSSTSDQQKRGKCENRLAFLMRSGYVYEDKFSFALFLVSVCFFTQKTYVTRSCLQFWESQASAHMFFTYVHVYNRHPANIESQGMFSDHLNRFKIENGCQKPREVHVN